jgi:hypothetical protein
MKAQDHDYGAALFGDTNAHLWSRHLADQAEREVVRFPIRLTHKVLLALLERERVYSRPATGKRKQR